MHRTNVSDIGEFIQHKSCPRRFRLDHDGEDFSNLGLDIQDFVDVDPVLQAVGARREEEWEESLLRAGLVRIAEPYPGDKIILWIDFIQSLEMLDIPESGFAREVQVEGSIGAFHLRGRIDFVILSFEEGRPHLRLVECKASRKDRTYHRVQAILYRAMVRAAFEQYPPVIAGMTLDPRDVQCVVVRIDETTHAIQSILDTPPFLLSDAIEADVQRLLAPEGVLDRTLRAEFDTLPYQLDAGCDACHFAPHCFVDAARGRKLELLGLPPGMIRALKSCDVQTLDDLADLQIDSVLAGTIRAHEEFGGDLSTLHLRARARRATLNSKGGVARLPNSGYGQLPEHEIGHEGVHPRLIRVFMNVSYDYTENRVVGLSAQITDATTRLEVGEEGVFEAPFEGDARNPEGSTHTLVRFRRTAWSGTYHTDNGSELELVQGFFREVIDSVELLSEGSSKGALHFYVWSSQEIRWLLESAGRVGSGLMSSLRELFGCRDKLEQLMISSLQHEVGTRFTHSWTSQGLVPVVSLPWYKRRFHWRRRVGQKVVSLSDVFSRDVFDFVREMDGVMTEVRAHFSDNLPAPYWHSYWGSLPESGLGPYAQSREPFVLETYLRSRTEALRWLEESIQPKNRSLTKQALEIRGLPNFRLGTNDAVGAAIDFLRFDQHIKVSQWVRSHQISPYVRVSNGASVPISNLRMDGTFQVRGTIDPQLYDIDLATIYRRSMLEVGDFVRMNQVRDIHVGVPFDSLLFGRTCVVNEIHWKTGEIVLQLMRTSNSEDVYVPRSWSFSENHRPFEKATLDASFADFVGQRVERRLLTGPAGSAKIGGHIIEWFDPIAPNVPPIRSLSDARTQVATELMEARQILPDRRAIVMRGLQSRLQLVQGPPGTGKTTLTAVAILMRILERVDPGQVVVVTANTHTAVDTLLSRTADALADWPEIQSALQTSGKTIKFWRMGSNNENDHPQIEKLPNRANEMDAVADALNTFGRQGGIAVVGGTTGGILKFGELVGAKLTSARGSGFRVPLLIVDEASMMVFAHFLAVASHVHPDGAMLLAGDHRQLSPIVGHDWTREDRPPAVLYQPHLSAFEGILNLAPQIQKAVPQSQALRRVSLDGLETTFRLPEPIRRLISPVYLQDGIALRGPKTSSLLNHRVHSFGELWAQGNLYLVLHDEVLSRNANPFEVRLIAELLESAPSQDTGSVAVITPHRAQRALLKLRLLKSDRASEIAVIDTVERMQGGECPTIIYSATVSDPVTITQTEQFILDLNRSNVAFSRTQERLFVVCSRSVLDHIPATVEAYEAAMLWKYLRLICTREVLRTEIEGQIVQVLTPGLA